MPDNCQRLKSVLKRDHGYHGDSWLFSKNALSRQTENFTYIPEKTPERDSSSTVWETMDISLDARIKQIIKAVINSKKNNCPFRGARNTRPYSYGQGKAGDKRNLRRLRIIGRDVLRRTSCQIQINNCTETLLPW